MRRASSCKISFRRCSTFSCVNAFPLRLAFFNAAALERLPAAMQAAVLGAGADTETRQFVAIGTRVSENAARMAANGVAVASAAGLRATLAEAAAPVIAAWTLRAGDEGAAILAAYNA